MKNNMFYTVALMMAVACVLGACDGNGDANEVLSTATPVVIAGVECTFDPEDEGVQWKAGKKIGVFLLEEGETSAIEPYSNVEYHSTTYPEGYFTPAAKENIICLPQDGRKVNLIAYYPYDAYLSDGIRLVDVSDQTKTVDFLYASNGDGMSKDNNKVTLAFCPVVAQMAVKLIPGDGVTEEYLTEPVITIKGMPVRANFNLLSRAFEPVEDASADIVMKTRDDANGGVAQMIPATSTEGSELIIFLPKMGRTYTWTLSEGIDEMNCGMRYNCNIRIDLEKIEVETEKEPIENWTIGQDYTNGAVQENWIRVPIEDFPIGEVAATSSDAVSAYQPDTWFCRVANSNAAGALSVEYDETQKRNVLHATVSKQLSWYGVFWGYRMEEARPLVYTLKFKAKGTSGKDIKCAIKTADNRYFISNAVSTSAKPYTGSCQFRLGTTYQEYALEFDFAKTAKDIYSQAAGDLLDATTNGLEDFFIFFSPNAADTELYIDDMILETKKD